MWVITRHDDLVWLTRHEVLVNASLLLLAGHETTINLICNGTLAFIHHPAQWALLKQEPAGLARRTTEELAYQPSITFRSLKSLPVAWN